MKRLTLILSSLFLACCTTAMAQDCIKVMSYNIRMSAKSDGANSWKYRRQATTRMVQNERPALIGMQELCPDQLAYLDSTLTSYAHVGVGREDGKMAGEMMAIFYDKSLLDLQQWGSFWLSETPDKPSLGWDAAYKRTCTWSLLNYKTTGQPILFFNTHLDNLGAIAREHEVMMITDSICRIATRLQLGNDAMVFLTADFNSSSSNPIFLPLKEILTEARSITPGSDKDYTYNGFGHVDPSQSQQQLDENGNSDNEIVIDHIFSRGVRPLSFRVCRDDYGVPFISDHFPVVFECQLARKREVRRILAVGNSFSEDAVEQYLWEIAKDQGIELVVGNLYIPGCTLKRHASNVRNDAPDYAYRKIIDGVRLEKKHTSIREALADEDWELVTLQQASQLSGEFDSYEPFLTELIDSIGSIHRQLTPAALDSSPKTALPLAWHKTWAYAEDSNHSGFARYEHSQERMYNAINEAVAQLSGYPFVTIIPSGDAIQIARQTPLGDTLCRDGFHLNRQYGRYCCALTWAVRLLDIDATKVNWKPQAVTDAEATYARHSAMKACNQPVWSGNPLILDQYTADPSARVFGDTLWIYPSHDKSDATGFSMEDYHAFSTTDMMNWEDHGVVFNPLKDTDWAKKEAWAPDCVERNGKYYLYYPTDKRHIGVAVAESPAGPFIDPLGHPLISIDSPGVVCDRDFIDPCCFIDDDGQAYLYMGQNTPCCIKLNDDMISYDGEVHLLEGVHEFFEAAWMHKYQGRYYFSYSDGPFFGHEPRISYCIGDSPLGPFEYKGVVLGPVNSGTNHHSIVKYQGQWWLFFHTADLSLYNDPTKNGHPGVRRSICCEPLYYNADGTIREVHPTRSESRVKDNTAAPRHKGRERK